jgi:hypothetical protein
MGCISGIDDSNGSTPKAAHIVTDEINTEIAKNAKVSISGDSFIVLERVGPIECLFLCNEVIFG